ncbi:ATP-binding protein [Streptomyces sp. NPDC056390]|uniref:ATP-binding protein n=1 Tax=Streptomyces sp. NPDC056390 TaxID=3345806 RepID=UPI0035E355DA
MPLPHQEIRPAPEAVTGQHAAITLPAELRRVRDVRHFTAAVLSRWGLAGEEVPTAILIVGELAGNAAQHGRADLEVLLSLRGSVLDVEVVDSGAVYEGHPMTWADDDEHGRGMGIVETLADHRRTWESLSGWRTCARVTITPAPPSRPALPEANANSASTCSRSRSSRSAVA